MKVSMRILFCIDSLTGGGAEILLLRYVDIIKKQWKCDITLFVISGYGALMEYIPLDIYVYIGDKLTDEEISSFNNQVFDIEIGFLEGRAIKFIALRNSSAIKVGWIHTDMLNNNWCYQYYEEGMQEVMYNTMDYIVCISDFCARQFHLAFPNVYSKTVVCNNVLDFREMNKVKKHQFVNSSISLCFIGRLAHEKHPDVVIMAVKSLLIHKQTVFLSILGEGYLFDELNTLIKSNKLENNVRLLGYHARPYDMIASHDLLISMSNVEGSPLGIAEAYYLGVPIIASHSGGADDFSNRFGGVVHTEISSDALSDVIENLFAHNASLYKQLKSQINYKKVKELFGEEALISLFEHWKHDIGLT